MIGLLLIIFWVTFSICATAAGIYCVLKYKNKHPLLLTSSGVLTLLILLQVHYGNLSIAFLIFVTLLTVIAWEWSYWKISAQQKYLRGSALFSGLFLLTFLAYLMHVNITSVSGTPSIFSILYLIFSLLILIAYIWIKIKD